MPKSDHARLREVLELKYGSVDAMGWAPRLRLKYGYFTPDDHYEATVSDLVGRDTEWLDVGGGSAVFPSNPDLASLLARRCRRLVAVDPSDNIQENPYPHERYQCLLQEMEGSWQFSLVTARMVVEHVTEPAAFVSKLKEIVRPGGKVVIYTVNRWAPMTMLSAWTPMAVHHFAKRILWNTDEKDTFPVVYLMNSRSQLATLFAGVGFREVAFRRLDDCRTLAKWRPTQAAELTTWKVLRAVGIGYPESCILGVYERCGND